MNIKSARMLMILALPLLTIGVFRGFSSQATFKSETALVNVLFNALDKKGRFVDGMTAEDFQVYENGLPQEIEFFGKADDRENVILTIALLIDTSGSVKDKLKYEIDTASEFFRSILRPDKDLALIIQFDSQVSLVQDLTQNQENLERALRGLKAGNNTSLYDAIYLAAGEKLRYEAGRKVIVVISDGEDTKSLVSEQEALESAQRSDALIYGIGVRGQGSMGGFGALKRFSEQTGGLFFSPRARFEEIQKAFREIGTAIRGQYSLAYSSTDKIKDGRFRRIEIRCLKPGVRIQARQGYYAPLEKRGKN